MNAIFGNMSTDQFAVQFSLKQVQSGLVTSRHLLNCKLNCLEPWLVPAQIGSELSKIMSIFKKFLALLLSQGASTALEIAELLASCRNSVRIGTKFVAT